MDENTKFAKAIGEFNAVIEAKTGGRSIAIASLFYEPNREQTGMIIALAPGIAEGPPSVHAGSILEIAALAMTQVGYAHRSDQHVFDTAREIHDAIIALQDEMVDIDAVEQHANQIAHKETPAASVHSTTTPF